MPKPTTTFDIAIDFEAETCCQQGCSIVFAVPAEFSQARKRDHGWFCCPNGHQQKYVGETEEEKLRRELASARGNERYYRERTEALSRSVAAQKGAKTRILNRVKAGICPFCNRRFDALGIHVQAEHAAEIAAEVDAPTAAPAEP